MSSLSSRAELMRGEPVWPGKTDLDQLSIIKCSLGQLTASQNHTLITQAIYDEANIERLLTQTQSINESLERKLPTRVGQAGVEFVLTCLQMDPARRPTSDELLKHPFINSVKMTQFIRDSSPSVSSSVVRRQSGATITTTTSSHLPTTTSTNSNRMNKAVAGGGRLNSQALMMAVNSSTNSVQYFKTNNNNNSETTSRSNTSLASLNNQLSPNGNQNDTSGKVSSIPRAISKPSLGINDESRPLKQIKQQQQQQPSQQKYRNPKTTRIESELVVSRQNKKQAPYSNRSHYNHF